MSGGASGISDDQRASVGQKAQPRLHVSPVHGNRSRD